VSFAIDASDASDPVLYAGPWAGPWIALGGGLLHTEANTYPPSQGMHAALDVTALPEVIDAESIGPLETLRPWVDADGASFGVSRRQLEVRRYGTCSTMVDPRENEAALE
jgi:hypothetical protein